MRYIWLLIYLGINLVLGGPAYATRVPREDSECKIALETTAHGPKPWHFSERDGRVLVTSNKRDQLDRELGADPDEEEQNEAWEDALNQPPFAVAAGAHLLEVRFNRATGQYFVYLHEGAATEESRRIVLQPNVFLNHPHSATSNGRYLLTSNSTTTVLHVIDLEHGRLVLEVRGEHAESMQESDSDRLIANFSSDGQTLNVRHFEKVEAYDLTKFRPRLIRTYNLNLDSEEDLRDHRGHAHYVAESDGFILQYARRPIRWYQQSSFIEDLAFKSPEWESREVYGISDYAQKFFYAVRDERQIDMFTLPDRKFVKTLRAEHEIQRLSVSPDGHYLAYSSADGGVGIFDVRTKTPSIFIEIDVPNGEGDLLQFNGNHELIVGSMDFAQAWAFTLP